MGEKQTRLEKHLRARVRSEERPGGPEVPLCLLVIDGVGSSAYVARYGEFAGAAVVQRFAEVAENAMGEYQGKVSVALGDSIVAEFPGPEKAVRAAVDIQRRIVRLNKILQPPERLQVRCAIHHGVGFRRDSEVSGDAVDSVAHLGRRCGPAQILISRKVREAVALDHNLHCNWLGQVPVEGEPEPVDVFEVVWTDPDIYVEIRQHTTRALVCGALNAAGIALEEINLPGMPLAAWPREGAATEAPAPPTVPAGGRDTGVMPRSAAGASLDARYEIQTELGRGGMGVVYKARDRETSELVAIKVLRPEVAADAAGMERFKNELRIARKITHKNVCRIYEFQRTESSAYISMEFVEGESLRHILDTKGKLSLESGVDVARQMCVGIREAHTENVVHSDLKPENILVEPNGRVKLMDFGIARITTGATVAGDEGLVGTLAYMSPEQFEGKRVDPRADIYALGIILYEMFTGAHPFPADSTPALIKSHLHDPPAPPSQLEPAMPTHIERAVLKCLQKDPANRFQTVDQLGLALLAAPVPKSPARAAEPVPQDAGRPAAKPAVLSIPRGTIALPQSAVPVGASIKKPAPALPRETIALPQSAVPMGATLPQPAQRSTPARPARVAHDSTAPSAMADAPVPKWGMNPWVAVGLMLALAAAVAAFLIFR